MGAARRAVKTRQRFPVPGAARNLYLPVTRKGNPDSDALGWRKTRGSELVNLVSDEILSGVLGVVDGA